jgi:hypothetical protein
VDRWQCDHEWTEEQCCQLCDDGQDHGATWECLLQLDCGDDESPCWEVSC